MKNLKYFYILGAFVLGGLTMTSCGDDDDDGEFGGGGSGTAGSTVIGNTGNYLTQIGNYSLSYDSKGRLSAISAYGDAMEFTYNPNTIIFKDGNYDTHKLNVSYNSKGYVTSMSGSVTVKEADYSYTSSGTINVTYDGNGHATKLVSSSKETGVDEGVKYTETTTTNYTFTWKSGNLVKVVMEEVEIEDGDKETYKETYTIDYGNNKYPNTHKQYSFSLASTITGDFESIMAMVGMYGVGPDYLPVSIIEEWEENHNGKTHTGSSTTDFSYRFNDDGTIAFESGNYGSGYNYVYSSNK